MSKENKKYDDGKALLRELDNCQIFCVSPATEYDEHLEEGEISLSCIGTHEDPLIVTKDELRQIGEALIALAQ